MADSPLSTYKWWHVFLVYPALLASLAGAVPTVTQEVKAWKLGVASKRVQIVEEQHALWKKNLDCLQLKPVYTINVGDGAEVGVILCGSGDALLRYQRSPEVVAYTWVRYPEYARTSEQQHSAAGDVIAPRSQVVYGITRCVSLQSLMVLWVQYDDAESQLCHMEYIATVNGGRLSRKAVHCTACDV